MSNFNKKREMTNLTINHEGAVVHSLSPLEILFSKVLGSFFGESTMYEKRDAATEFADLQSLISSIPVQDKEYILKIAELGRLSNMIDFPLQVLAASFHEEAFKGEGFLDEYGKNKLAYYTDVIVRRSKDVNRILATHFEVFGDTRPMPAQMKKQLKSKLEQFDEYKLSKGLDSSKTISLRDSIKLLHPKPKTPEMAAFYKSIIENKVKRGNGKAEVEVALAHYGQSANTDNSVIDLRQSVFDTNLQGLLRHLSKLVEHGVFDDQEVLDVAVAKIRNKEAVHSAKLLPYRFYTSYHSLSNLAQTAEVLLLKDAIEEGLEHSIENVEEVPGLSVFLIDRSYSMAATKVSGQSSVTAEELAMLLGAIAYRKGFGDLFVFSTECVLVDISRKSPILEIVKAMKQVEEMNEGTDLGKALQFISDHSMAHGIQYQNLIFLSDNDCYHYDSKTNTLEISDLSWGWQDKDVLTADAHVNQLISEGVFQKMWINNLAGNTFAVANTKSNTKNLITGFSEKFLNIVSVYADLGNGRDIRQVIDALLVNEREKVRLAKEQARNRKFI